MFYEIGESERMFSFTKSYLGHEMERGCKASGVKKIRIHDLRHSHASLLVNQGEDYLVVKERLGHASITTTIDTYSHLYPSKQKTLANKLDDLF